MAESSIGPLDGAEGVDFITFTGVPILGELSNETSL